jgi:uncharacterized membrane protein YobD (UPF0266 family)
VPIVVLLPRVRGKLLRARIISIAPAYVVLVHVRAIDRTTVCARALFSVVMKESIYINFLQSEELIWKEAGSLFAKTLLSNIGRVEPPKSHRFVLCMLWDHHLSPRFQNKLFIS